MFGLECRVFGLCLVTCLRESWMSVLWLRAVPLRDLSRHCSVSSLATIRPASMAIRQMLQRQPSCVIGAFLEPSPPEQNSETPTVWIELAQLIDHVKTI